MTCIYNIHITHFELVHAFSEISINNMAAYGIDLIMTDSTCNVISIAECDSYIILYNSHKNNNTG